MNKVKFFQSIHFKFVLIYILLIVVAMGMFSEHARDAREAAKRRRYEELMEAQQRVAFEQAAYVASFYKNDPKDPAQFDVLIDRVGRAEGEATTGVSEGGRIHTGRCYFQAPQVDSVTYVHSREPLSPGELVRCAIVDSDGYDLIARPTAELEKRVSLRVLG